MRRELIFSSAGFLIGFVVAAAVFFQPAPELPQPAATSEKAAVVASRPESVLTDNERIGRPTVVQADEAPSSDEAAKPKTPATLLDEIIASLPGLDENNRDRVVADLIANLRKQGPAGLQVLRDFFKNGQDVKLRNGWGMSNGRVTSAPSLRVALLDALSDWPGATDLNLDVLRGAKSPFEASLALRNLEATSPGVYRNEAIRALSALADQSTRGDFAQQGLNHLFDAMRHFDAPELLPAAEKVVASNPWAAFQLIDALKDMAPEVRNPAYGRLFSNPKIAEQLASNPHTLRNLSYADPQVAQYAAQLYANGMSGKQRDRFLADFGSNRAFSFRNDFFAPQGAGRVATVIDTGNGLENVELKSRMAFLDQIAQHSTTPVLQQRLEEAREDLRNSMANPNKGFPVRPVEISGTKFISVGEGAGSMKIKGNAIQTIEVRQK
jgi:hypothetical protein